MKKKLFTLIVILFIGGTLTACSSKSELINNTLTDQNATSIPTENVTITATAIELTPTFTPEAETEVVPEETATEIYTPTPEPTSPPVAGSTRVSEIDQMVQVFVPEGEITLGSSDKEAKITLEGGRAYPEVPVNTVYLDSFWIDKYEVTNAQYALCVESGDCEAPFAFFSTTRPEYYGNPEYDDYPVIWVNWYMAGDYCDWAGRRLVKEAEWERASRGSFENKYPWGNDPISGDKANFCDVNCPKSWANSNFDDGYADTAPVGSFPAGASPFGVMDMSGNVWEWTGTLIMDYPYDLSDGREDLEAPGERAWRGGAWNDGYWWMRSSMRYRSVPFYWNFNLGFRCAASE